MKTKNLFLLLAFATIVFTSCKKDETNTDLTKEEAIAAIKSVDQSYVSDLNDYESSTAYQAMNAAENLNLPFFGTNEYAKMRMKSVQESIIKNSKSTLGKSKGDDGIDIDFIGNEGTYHYVNGEWIRTNLLPNDQIVVIFSYEGEFENGTLTYYDYAESTLSIDGEEEKYVSNLRCKVEIVGHNNPVASWRYIANFTESTFSYTAALSFEYTLGAFSETRSFSIKAGINGITTSVSDELKKNDVIIRAVSFNSKTTGNENRYSSTIDARFQISDIVIKWAITITQDTNLAGDPNLYQTISVWTADEEKVADIIYKNILGDWIPYFVFTDGTEAPISLYVNQGLFYELLEFNGLLLDTDFK